MVYKPHFFHGLMFHHFHDKSKYKRSQGSISEKNFEKILHYVGINNILSPEKFYEKLIKKKLKKNELCLTFDDGLKCQVEVAKPILDKYNLKAFFFIYSSILIGKPDNLEIFREFRNHNFKNVNQFYNCFFKKISSFYKIDINNEIKKNIKTFNSYKKNFKFYSNKDIIFRILRDFTFGKKKYEKIMLLLMEEYKANTKKMLRDIYMTKKDIKNLSLDGHQIGLHSHNHPTNLESLPFQKQKYEYKKNKSMLEKITNKNIYSMSHPCGSYNKDTLRILKSLKIQIGFKQIMKIDHRIKKINSSFLEVAREDHANLIKKY